MTFSIDERKEIAKMVLEGLRDLGVKDKFLRKARIWSGGNKVRIYGLEKTFGFICVKETGEVKPIDFDNYEVLIALDELKKTKLKNIEQEIEKRNEEKQEEEAAFQRRMVRLEPFLKKKYRSEDEAYRDLEKNFQPITGVSDKQVKYAESVRKQTVKGLAYKLYQLHNADGDDYHPAEFYQDAAKDWIRKYQSNYEYILTETNAKNIIEKNRI